MTEITVDAVELTPALRRFILHWGDLGGEWGVNRSVAQIHALLFVADRPLTAEAIAETLSLARSNVSNSLRELTAWDLVRREPILGDRRDHFVAEGDVWEMAARIVAMRKAREFDPAAAVLRACVAEARRDGKTQSVALGRLAELEDFVATLDGWYGQMRAVPKSTLLPIIRLGARIVDLAKPFLKKNPE